jgi:hypothetical protein
MSDTEVVLYEGVRNIVTVIIGENLYDRHQVIMKNTGLQSSGATLWDVSASVVEPSTGRKMLCKSSIPVMPPVAEVMGTCIANRFFTVAVDDYLKHFRFEAWCEHNPYNGAMTIVRMICPQSSDKWLIGGGMDNTVEYRGEFARMPQWAKDIAYKNFGGWIDTPGANLGPLVTD